MRSIVWTRARLDILKRYIAAAAEAGTTEFAIPAEDMGQAGDDFEFDVGFARYLADYLERRLA